MKFTLTKTSNWNLKKEIEINSLDELLKLADEEDIILKYRDKERI